MPRFTSSDYIRMADATRRGLVPRAVIEMLERAAALLHSLEQAVEVHGKVAADSYAQQMLDGTADYERP